MKSLLTILVFSLIVLGCVAIYFGMLGHFIFGTLLLAGLFLIGGIIAMLLTNSKNS